MYINSLTRHESSTLFITKENNEKVLYVFGRGEAYDSLDGEQRLLPGGEAKCCRMTNANAKTIRRLFPYTNPVRHKGRPFTLGLGDRLGLASAGHIRLIKDSAIDVFPVLAQQSMRELNLTNRTYEDVFSAAVWAVFQEGYTKGYGADGDHLKTRGEIKAALDCGFSMITLDCSEHINQDGDNIEAIYRGAIDHSINIYNDLIRGNNVDFEISIDETSFTTTPEAHYFVANELQKAGVEITSLAPRFCGEFQKGIDYKGDINAFASEFKAHFKIAEKAGYKLSVHSGSDKFKVFPIVYKETGRKVHIKTAGTNWLEALRTIAQKKPELFTEIFKFATANLSEAKKYYKITENTANIPDINTLSGDMLPALLDQDDARQVLHITYGAVLSSFKNAVYSTLNEYENEYYDALYKHIGRHIEGN